MRNSSIREEFYSRNPNQGIPVEERLARVIRIFREFSGGSRLLDVGCADGSITRLLGQASGAAEIYGVDIAADAVMHARGLGIQAHRLDVDEDDLPFENEFFDYAYLGEVIEHVFAPDRLLLEVRRTLRPGGICVLTTPNLAGWPNRLALLIGYQPYPTAVSPIQEGLGKLFIRGSEGQWGHIRVFTLRALIELVRAYSFAIIKIEGCSSTVSSRKIALVRVIDMMMSQVPSLATRVVLVLRKLTR